MPRWPRPRPWPRSSASSGEFQLTYGRLLLPKADYAGAAEALAKAAASLPGSAEAHARLGFAYQYTGKTAEALEAYKKAVELDPKNIEYRTTYGLILGINKQPDAGITELNKVIATPGYKSADAYLNLGWLYRNTQPRRAEESVAAYKKALELDPTNEQAALGMAWAYSYMKNYDESIKAFEKAMQLDPSLTADAYNGIGWAHFFKKDLATAESFVAKAKTAGRADARLAENIDRVRKGLEAKEREEAEPAPVPRPVQADAGTLSAVILGRETRGQVQGRARHREVRRRRRVRAHRRAARREHGRPDLRGARAGRDRSPRRVGAGAPPAGGVGLQEREGDPHRGRHGERSQVRPARQRRPRHGGEDKVAGYLRTSQLRSMPPAGAAGTAEPSLVWQIRPEWSPLNARMPVWYRLVGSASYL